MCTNYHKSCTRYACAFLRMAIHTNNSDVWVFVGKNKTHTSWENKNDQLVGTNTSSEGYKNIFIRFGSRYR